MDDKETEAVCAKIDELARRIGCRFVPSPTKIDAYKHRRKEFK